MVHPKDVLSTLSYMPSGARPSRKSRPWSNTHHKVIVDWRQAGASTQKGQRSYIQRRQLKKKGKVAPNSFVPQLWQEAPARKAWPASRSRMWPRGQCFLTFLSSAAHMALPRQRTLGLPSAASLLASQHTSQTTRLHLAQLMLCSLRRISWEHSSHCLLDKQPGQWLGFLGLHWCPGAHGEPTPTAAAGGHPASAASSPACPNSPSSGGRLRCDDGEAPSAGEAVPSLPSSSPMAASASEKTSCAQVACISCESEGAAAW
mmetsp:Transcript_90573/g.251846  ORF Transcript_90573/g.251846 Transcript_90573/m.251846 type:complete len:260 (-) Transcript_90573:861-1640(-)